MSSIDFKKDKKWTHLRHYAFGKFVSAVLRPYYRHHLHINFKRYKLKRHENVLIMSNHQTNIDGLIINCSFNRYIYPVVTNSFFSSKWSKFLGYMLGMVSKKKGLVDIDCTQTMFKIIEEGGSVLLFLEGNRTYAEFQYYIAPTTAKMIKKAGIPLIIYNITGGTGTSPRWGKKRRAGKMKCFVKARLEPEQYMAMSDTELNKFVADNLRVYDSESGNKYKTDARAECMERMFFYCPKCHSFETIYSKGNYVYCKKCDFKAEFKEDLHLVTEPSLKISLLNDWYQLQKKAIYKLDVSKINLLFKDQDVKLFLAEKGKARKLLDKGNCALFKDAFKVEDYEIPLKDIIIASPVNGASLTITTKDHDYLVIGSETFNPLKYMFGFNKLDTDMKMNNRDKYYRIDE